TRLAKPEELWSLQTRDESQFFDRKSARITPAKISQSFSSLANADGGEVVLGVEDDGSLAPYASIEAANDVVALAARIMRHEYYTVEFVANDATPGVLVLFTIDRHPNVVETESGNVYQRHGAQNLRLQGEQLEALRRS